MARKRSKSRISKPSKVMAQANGPKGISALDTEADIWKPQKEGWYDMDIIQFEKEDGTYSYVQLYYIHKFVGPEKETFLCNKNWGEPCPLCQVTNALYDNGNEQEAGKIKAKKMQLFNVVSEGKVKVFDFSPFKFGQALEKELKNTENPDYVNFSEQEAGYTLAVRFDNATFSGNTYLTTGKINFKERPDISDEIWEQAVQFDKHLKKPDERKMQDVADLFAPATFEQTRPAADNPADKTHFDVDEQEDDAAVMDKFEDKKTPAKDCPQGGVFGKDIDAFDACDTCELYEECDAKYKESL